MTERPVLFSDAMVRAILSGAKTQTRRVIQAPAKNMQRAGMCVIKNRAPGDPWYGDHVWSMRGSMGVWGDYTDERFRSLCPYGAPGDRLWVRETLRRTENVWRYAADGEQLRISMDDIPAMVSWAHHRESDVCVSIHMPRWASRLTLEVTNVRVERVQAISGADARAEGAEPTEEGGVFGTPDYRGAFCALWDSINGERTGCSWSDDPWVWVVSFRRLGGAR